MMLQGVNAKALYDSNSTILINTNIFRIGLILFPIKLTWSNRMSSINQNKPSSKICSIFRIFGLSKLKIKVDENASNWKKDFLKSSVPDYSLFMGTSSLQFASALLIKSYRNFSRLRDLENLSNALWIQ